MITFQLRQRKLVDLEGWEIRVDAILSLEDEPHLTDELYNKFKELPQVPDFEGGDLGVRVACLSAIVIRELVSETDDLLELIRSQTEAGGIFDVLTGTYMTADAMCAWMESGGGDDICGGPGDPVDAIVITEDLECDDFVDRGAMLAYMMPHLSALTPDRILVVHQEPADSTLPPDQQGRLNERMLAVGGISDRMGVEVFGLHPGRPESESTGDAIDLPLFILGIPEYGPENARWEHSAEEELELIDFSDWAEARLGIRPQALPDSRPELSL